MLLVFYKPSSLEVCTIWLESWRANTLSSCLSLTYWRTSWNSFLALLTSSPHPQKKYLSLHFSLSSRLTILERLLWVVIRWASERLKNLVEVILSHLTMAHNSSWCMARLPMKCSTSKQRFSLERMKVNSSRVPFYRNTNQVARTEFSFYHPKSLKNFLKVHLSFWSMQRLSLLMMT